MTTPPPAKPAYKAELPWAGPVLGHYDDSDAILISGAVDPARGKASLVLFVPVTRNGDGKRFERAPGSEPAFKSRNVQSDGNGWFTVDAERSWWRETVNGKQAEGLLVVLLYETSPNSRAATPTEKEFETDRIHQALDTLLEEPAQELELGLIEIDGEAHVASAKAGSPPKQFCFALTSCQYPVGMLDATVAFGSYRRLAKQLKANSGDARPQFLLLLGDQVYVDATAGMFDPSEQHDRFVAPYRNLLNQPAVKDVLRRLPAYMMLDDHEIEDGWEPLAADRHDDHNLTAGRDCYLRFQRAGGPPRQRPEGDSPEPLWYEFERSEFPFFIADTRTERQRRTAATIKNAGIMSDTQFTKLLCWLSKQRDDVPKFIASPAIFLPRRRSTAQHEHVASALRSDAWDGYPKSFHGLLAYLAEQQIKNVVFLSGDEHLSCVAQATITAAGKPPVSILSIHSSGLYAPFPFANSVPEIFPEEETFPFALTGEELSASRERLPDQALKRDGLRKFECRVEIRDFRAGDGFAILDVFRDNGEWTLRCHFNRANGGTGVRAYSLSPVP